MTNSINPVCPTSAKMIQRICGLAHAEMGQYLVKVTYQSNHHVRLMFERKYGRPIEAEDIMNCHFFAITVQHDDEVTKGIVEFDDYRFRRDTGGAHIYDLEMAFDILC